MRTKLFNGAFDLLVKFCKVSPNDYIVTKGDKEAADANQKLVIVELEKTFVDSISKNFKFRVEDRCIIISFGEKYGNLTHVHESKDPNRIWWVDIVMLQQKGVDSWEIKYHCLDDGWLKESKIFKEDIRFRTEELMEYTAKSLRRKGVFNYIRYYYRERP